MSDRIFISRLTGTAVFDPQGDQLGKVRDTVVHLRHSNNPPRIIGLLVEVPQRRLVFLPMSRVTDFDARQIISTGVVTTLAGNTSGTSGYVNATGTSAYFYNPVGIASDGTNLYVTDFNNHAIRKIVISTGVVTTLAGSGTTGFVNATGTAAYFAYPLGITYYSGNLYITDQLGTRIRIVSTSTGATTTLY